MAKVEMRFNGRKITSAGQLQRELKKAIEKTAENALKRAAGPGVTVRKNGPGFVAEGSPADIERLRRRLR